MAQLANRLRFPKRTSVMAKAQRLRDVAIKLNSSIDSTNVLSIPDIFSSLKKIPFSLEQSTSSLEK